MNKENLQLFLFKKIISGEIVTKVTLSSQIIWYLKLSLNSQVDNLTKTQKSKNSNKMGIHWCKTMRLSLQPGCGNWGSLDLMMTREEVTLGFGKLFLLAPELGNVRIFFHPSGLHPSSQDEMSKPQGQRQETDNFSPSSQLQSRRHMPSKRGTWV